MLRVLKTRVITALVLVSLLLPSLFFLSPLNWALLVAAFIGVAAWEWGALLGWAYAPRIVLGVTTTILCALVSWFVPAVISGADTLATPIGVVFAYGLSFAFWTMVIPLWLRQKWSLSGVAGLVVGGIVLLPTWLAMVQLRVLAPVLLLAVFAVVWIADIAAYFAGRAFGKHKLAPSISPGKTWEGAIGAIVGVLIYGLVMRYLHFSALMDLLPWILLMLLVTAVSIVGDLFESLLKRKAGIKDSSNVLPGHGGVLDRIDSLTSTLPVVAFIYFFVLRGAA